MEDRMGKGEGEAHIDEDRLRLLLQEMVDIYSPSGKEEEVIAYVGDQLRQHGLPVTLQPVDEQLSNLLVIPESQDDVELCFVGHVDTVAAYDLDDYGFEMVEDEVRGLGTVDMKSGCAAMVEACIALHESGSMPPVALALVVDEEEDNAGARAVVAEYHFPWAVVGEPTGLEPCLGHYGYMEVFLRAKGKRAHSAVPEYGHNAIEAMLRLVLDVTDFATSEGSRLVYNIRELSALPSGFVVPDLCEAWLDFHLPPDMRIDALKTDLERIVGSRTSAVPELDLYMRFEDTYAGYEISPDRVFVRQLRDVYRGMSLEWRPQQFRSHSDGNVLWAAGIDPLIIGPGRLDLAHSQDEAVAFSEVATAARLYLNLARSIGRTWR
jgi:acetylornithine deacetylase